MTLKIFFFLFGFFIGCVVFYGYRYTMALLKEDLGKHYMLYKNLKIMIELKSMITHIIVSFNIRRVNYDFLLDVKYDEMLFVQVAHRAYFPYLSRENLDFGLVIYVLSGRLSSIQKQKLEEILGELRPFEKETAPFYWYAVDTGKSVRLTALIIARIIREVYDTEPDKNKLSLRLIDSGPSPFIRQKLEADRLGNKFSTSGRTFSF